MGKGRRKELKKSFPQTKIPTFEGKPIKGAYHPIVSSIRKNELLFKGREIQL